MSDSPVSANPDMWFFRKINFFIQTFYMFQIVVWMSRKIMIWLGTLILCSSFTLAMWDSTKTLKLLRCWRYGVDQNSSLWPMVTIQCMHFRPFVQYAWRTIIPTYSDNFWHVLRLVLGSKAVTVLTNKKGKISKSRIRLLI